jgi:hypothetical protein
MALMPEVPSDWESSMAPPLPVPCTDASFTHMYAPGTGRHIQAALKAGATPEHIMTILQLWVSMGVQACANAVPILAEELERAEPVFSLNRANPRLATKEY